ncbi:MAG: efflux RND transporter periplasmic adaptor subunit [Pseudomonadota bacterium]
MSDDRQALLRELSIERAEPAARSGGGGLSLWAVLALMVLAGVMGAAASWWFNRTPAPVTVRVASVERLGEDGVGAPLSDPTQSVLDATGYVTARRQATVSSEVTGRVVEVLVEEGMAVEEGQLLARLDDTLLVAAVELAQAQLAASQAALEETRAQLREAQRNLTRIEDLQGRGLASEQELDAALADEDTFTARLARQQRDVEVSAKSLAVQERQLEDMRIVAPFAGVVIDKAAQPGEMISPVSAGGGFTRTGICTLVDMDSLEVEVDVNESFLGRVSAGQPVTATLNSYPDWRIPAEVITIIPAADRNRATVRVRIRLLERDARILPDMGARVAFLAGQGEQTPTPSRIASKDDDEGDVRAGLYVPSDAIYRDGTRAVAYVVMGARAEVRELRVGETRGSRRRVLGGVEAGEQVVLGVDEALVRAFDGGASVMVANP